MRTDLVLLNISTIVYNENFHKLTKSAKNHNN